MAKTDLKLKYPWMVNRDFFPFKHYETEHLCPECGTNLTKVDVSTMLACVEGHGPYFLV